MLWEEKVRVLIFLSLVAAVYVFAAGSLVRIFLKRFGIGKLSETAFQIWFRRIVFSFAGFGFFCFAYGYFVEPYWLEVRRVEIRSAKVKSAFRVVHISDIHSDALPRLEEKLANAIAEQKPDFVVFSGDSTNSNEGLPVFKKCLTEIAKVAPTFVVKGNWDLGTENLFEGTGAVWLRGSIENVEIKQNKVSLVGVSAFDTFKLNEKLETLPAENFNLFLYHLPDEIENIANSNVDLYCAGHTHGGQIRLPFYGALITFSKFDKKYEAGTFEVGKVWLNVNRGIGMEGESAPRVRFYCRPEISVIDVLPD